MSHATKFWQLLIWQELPELVATCRQGRHMRLVALLQGHTTRSTYYWKRLELMAMCSESALLLEKLMWYHDAKHTGRCGQVLTRVGESHTIGWQNAELVLLLPG